MPPKDPKSTLKEAREAIKNKNYELAMKLSKAALKEDRDNYMALVFLGVSLQEVGPACQALNAFRKAIELNCTNVLAWNGLANYLEKVDEDGAKKELVSVYCKLLEIESNERKLCEYCEKLASLVRYGDELSIIRSIYAIFDKEDCAPKVKEHFATVILSLSPSSTPDELIAIHGNVLKFVTSNTKLVTINYYSDYLKYLYKTQNYDVLWDEAEKMHLLYETNATSLEWICKMYNETVVEKKDLPRCWSVKIESFCDSLLKLQPESAMGVFTKGLLIMKENLLEAKDLLKKVTSKRPGLLYAWVQLAEFCLNLHLHGDSLHSSMKADRLLESIQNSNKILRNRVDVLLLDGYSRSGDEKHWQLAIELFEKMNSTAQEALSSITRAYLNAEDYELAERHLSKIKEVHGATSSYVLLSAQVLRKKGKVQEALDVLNSNIDLATSDIFLEMGDLYWQSKLFEESLLPYLKAAKMDPNNYKCFASLGRYYDTFADFDRARRCYEKAFKLNPDCVEIGIELSKIYRELKSWVNRGKTDIISGIGCKNCSLLQGTSLYEVKKSIVRI